MNSTLEPYPKILSIQNTSVDIITISLRIPRARLLRVYRVWKRILVHSLIFSLLLAIPNCIHVELPSFAYTKNETHIYYNVIPSKDQ